MRQIGTRATANPSPTPAADGGFAGVVRMIVVVVVVVVEKFVGIVDEVVVVMTTIDDVEGGDIKGGHNDSGGECQW